MSTWKSVERNIATLVGGERVPVTGRGRGSEPDIAHPWLSLEVKHRKALPGWMVDAMAQARASDKGGQLPMVVFHQKQMKYEDSVCMIRLADFVEWFGDDHHS